MVIWSSRNRLLALACMCIAIAACGGKSEKNAAPADDPQISGESSPFRNMRPGPEDRMALPRLGFAWEFDPSDASLPGAEIEGIRFVVHVTGPSGEPHDTTGTWLDEAMMDLHPDFQPGECAWWVEAFLPDGSVRRSPRSVFTIVE